MTQEVVTISIADSLQNRAEDVEQFYASIDRLPRATQYVFDMDRVTFITPYGVIALIMIARRLTAIAGRPVRLAHLDTQVYLYLQRIDLFRTCSACIESAEVLDDTWSRNPQTHNLLELTPIRGPLEIATIVNRAEAIFSRWLMPTNLSNFLRVLSELYTNVYEHSGDLQGSVLIQKYGPSFSVPGRVCLAVGDLGRGIRGSLQSYYPSLGPDPKAYLEAALTGETGRPTRRGGLGLRRIRQIVATYGGYLWLRSETAAVCSHGLDDMRLWPNLVLLPGTQVAVELHIPVGD